MTAALILTLLLYFGVGVAVKADVVAGRLAPLVRAGDATLPVPLLHPPGPLAGIVFSGSPDAVVLAGIVFSGVAAAIMSTVNSFLSIGAAVVTHDIPVALGRRLPGELLWGRLSTAGISVLAALLAQRSGTLVAFLGIFGGGLF